MHTRLWSTTQHAYEALVDLLTHELTAQSSPYRLCSVQMMSRAYEETRRQIPAQMPHRNEFFWLAALLFRYVLVECWAEHQNRPPSTPTKELRDTLRDGHLVGGSGQDEVLEFGHLQPFHEWLSRLEVEQPRQGQIVIMRMFAGMEFSDIAEVLALPKPVVTSLWFQAKKSLTETLPPIDPAP